MAKQLTLLDTATTTRSIRRWKRRRRKTEGFLCSDRIIYDDVMVRHNDITSLYIVTCTKTKLEKQVMKTNCFHLSLNSRRILVTTRQRKKYSNIYNIYHDFIKYNQLFLCDLYPPIRPRSYTYHLYKIY